MQSSLVADRPIKVGLADRRLRLALVSAPARLPENDRL